MAYCEQMVKCGRKPIGDFQSHADDSDGGPCCPNSPGSYSTHIILVARVRPKRQRLHSNGSIETSPANHHPRPSPTFSRRVTPDRDLTFMESNALLADKRVRRTGRHAIGVLVWHRQMGSSSAERAAAK